MDAPRRVVLFAVRLSLYVCLEMYHTSWLKEIWSDGRNGLD